jgi:hypothetical protein
MAFTRQPCALVQRRDLVPTRYAMRDGLAAPSHAIGSPSCAVAEPSSRYAFTAVCQTITKLEDVKHPHVKLPLARPAAPSRRVRKHVAAT